VRPPLLDWLFAAWRMSVDNAVAGADCLNACTSSRTAAVAPAATTHSRWSAKKADDVTMEERVFLSGDVMDCVGGGRYPNETSCV
jgi:hypothetical protein